MKNVSLADLKVILKRRDAGQALTEQEKEVIKFAESQSRDIGKVIQDRTRDAVRVIQDRLQEASAQMAALGKEFSTHPDVIGLFQLLRTLRNLLNDPKIAASPAATHRFHEMVTWLGQSNIPQLREDGFPGIKLHALADELARTRVQADLFEQVKIERDQNLAEGRSKGTQRRKEVSKAKKVRLNKAIDALFQHGKGWSMTNDEIADYLLERGVSDYTKKSTLRRVNTYAAAARETHKQRLKN